MTHQPSADDLRGAAVEALRARLPLSWSVETVVVGAAGEHDLLIRDGRGSECSVLVEALASPPDIRSLTSGLSKRLRSQSGLPPILLIAPYLGPGDRDLLRREDISYLDLTGNVRVVTDSPGLFIETEGAWHDPSSKAPPASLRGAKAGAIVRLLIDVRPPYRAADVARAAQVNQGYVSRVLDFLGEQGFIERDGRGPITAVDWPQLIRHRAGQVDLSRQGHRFAAPDGPWGTMASLAQATSDVLITGSFAAARLAPIDPVLLAAYTMQPRAVARRLRLTPTDHGHDAIFLQPEDRSVFQRRDIDDNLSFAAPSQVAIDCLSGEGHMADHGEAVMNWMAENEDCWRCPSLEQATS